MPTYTYRCTKCGEEYEVVQSMSDPPLKRCKKCRGALRRIYDPAAIVLKGSGFHRNDYRPKAPAAKKESSEKSETTDKTDKKDTSKDSSSKESSGGANTSTGQGGAKAPSGSDSTSSASGTAKS